MYWSDVGKNPKIEQAGMDGTARRVIVSTNLGLPTGLAIDHSSNRLYWTDAKLDRIEEFNLNTRNRKIIVSFNAGVTPYGLTMYQGWLYWSDWQTKSISRISANSGNKEVMVTGLKRPMDLFVYDQASSSPGTSLDFRTCILGTVQQLVGSLLKGKGLHYVKTLHKKMYTKYKT